MIFGAPFALIKSWVSDRYNYLTDQTCRQLCSLTTAIKTMNRETFQLVSRQRKREAAALIRAGLYSGAYYLAGYSVECALKACIARQTNRYDFPNKKLAADAWTHDLEKLVQLAGLVPDFERDRKASRALEVNWTIVKDWSEAVRYELSVTRAQARQMYSACTARRTGILSWIRVRW